MDGVAILACSTAGRASTAEGTCLFSWRGFSPAGQHVPTPAKHSQQPPLPLLSPAGAADGEQAPHPIHGILRDGEGPPAQLVGGDHGVAEVGSERLGCAGDAEAGGEGWGAGYLGEDGETRDTRGVALTLGWRCLTPSPLCAPPLNVILKPVGCKECTVPLSEPSQRHTWEVDGVEGLVSYGGPNAVEPAAAVEGAGGGEGAAAQLLSVQAVGAYLWVEGRGRGRQGAAGSW